MKKLVLSLPIAIAIGLSGCGGDDTTLQELNDNVAKNNETVLPLARVVFDPTAGRLSVPNDLLFSGTTDGTLEMPAEVAARQANGHADYSSPSQAMGVLDGWSTQNPFVLGLDFPTGMSLNSDSAGAPGAIRIFQVKMGGEQGCEAVPRGVACAPVAELTFGVDFVTTASGNSVVVAPLKPLKPATTYLLAITNQLKDNISRGVAASTTYELVKQDINTHPLGTASQLALQGVINSFETVIADGFGVDKGSITYTSAMTTQSIGQVLPTIKLMMAANLANPVLKPVVDVNYTGISVGDVLLNSGILDIDSPTLSGFKATKLYQGTVSLPYYLATPTTDNPEAPLNTPWKAACDTAVMVSAYAAQVGDEYPYNPATTAPLSQNDGLCIALSGGLLRDFTNPETGYGLDKERHLTKYNKIPQMRSIQQLEVQMTEPDVEQVNNIRAFMGLAPIAMPEAGWPVVMLQHGIPSRKEDMLWGTASLSLAGFASVAIDLPLHSSRGFDVNNDGQDDINAYSITPTHFFNLGNLPVTRDNVRQGVADMMGLRLGLNFAQNINIDASKVYAMGLSLGAITATNFLAVTNTKNLDAALGAPGLDSMFAVRSAVLASPGGGLANILAESPAFGPLVQAGILKGAGSALSNEFNAYLAGPVMECVSFLPNQDAYGSCGYNMFKQSLAESGQTAKLAEIQAVVSQFVFAAQTVTDGGDPNNFAAMLAGNETPILLTEVVGDGADNLSDQVVGNQTVNAPIGGTEPLIRALGLQDKAISATKVGDIVDGAPSSFSTVIRYVKGHHSSLLNPRAQSSAPDGAANARVTAEMQSQGVSFFASDGTAVVINDGEYILGNQ